MPRPPVVALLLLTLTTLLLAPAHATAAPQLHGEHISPTAWLSEMADYFTANPDLKDQPGSGWNYYNRQKWFITPRLDAEGNLPPGDARWKVWERKVELESRGRATNTWFSLGPTNFGGRILSMDFDPTDPSVVYVGACDGGVWRSTDSGTSWTPLSDEIPVLAIGGIAVSKTNPSIIVIGTGMGASSAVRVGGVGILRSTDAGATWITTDFVQAPVADGGGHGFHVVECGPNGTFLAGATDGLYRSSDDGATWTQVKTGSDWYDVAWKPGDPNRVYTVRGDATPGSSVKVSSDDGITWTKVGTGQPQSFVFGKAKLGLSGSTIYCAIGEVGGPGFYDLIRSDDDGATWASTNPSGLPSGQSWLNVVCAADPNNVNRVTVGCVGLARSNDGGATFNSTLGSMHVDQHVIKYEPGSNTNVWMGNDGGIYRSTSDGANTTWLSKNNGLVTYQFYDICVNNGPLPYYALGGTQDNGTDKWSGTTVWANAIGADGMVCNVGSDGTTVYGEIQFGTQYRSTNSGTSFVTNNTGITGSGAWVTPVALDPADPNDLLLSTSAGIFRTTTGTSWSNVASHTATWIDISRADGNVAWTINASNAHYTTDNGSTWNVAAPYGFSTGAVNKIAAHPTDVNQAVAVFSGYTATAKVAHTTDMGASWTDATGDLPDVPVNTVVVDPSVPDRWFIGTDVGCWVTRDAGTHWYPFESGLPNAVVTDLEIADAQRKLVAGTLGRGMWEVDITTVASDAPSIAGGPRDLMLDEPYPNPVTDRTFLRFAAKTDAPVSLRVYDVQGRLVTDVADLSHGDGVIRTAPWIPDGAPAGVYFAVLQAGAEQTSRKVTVIR